MGERMAYTTPMSRDDEFDMSTSSAEYLESSTKAKREALKRKLEKVGQKNAASMPLADLKSLKLALLKSQVSKTDDASKKDQQVNKSSSFGTKTREQEIAASKQDAADSRSTIDQMMQAGKEQQKEKEEMQRQGDVQSEGG